MCYKRVEVSYEYTQKHTGNWGVTVKLDNGITFYIECGHHFTAEKLYYCLKGNHIEMVGR